MSNKERIEELSGAIDRLSATVDFALMAVEIIARETGSTGVTSGKDAPRGQVIFTADKLRVEDSHGNVVVENPKPIDWSQVADCVPVKVWDGHESDIAILYPGISTHFWSALHDWHHRSLITGIDIAWSGGECPLPEGVIVTYRMRGGERRSTTKAASKAWSHNGSAGDIISFRIESIADGWTEEAG